MTHAEQLIRAMRHGERIARRVGPDGLKRWKVVKAKSRLHINGGGN